MSIAPTSACVGERHRLSGSSPCIPILGPAVDEFRILLHSIASFGASPRNIDHGAWFIRCYRRLEGIQ